MVMNSLGNRNFMQPMGRLSTHSKGPNFLSFGLGGKDFFFSFFLCSQHVPFKFPMGSLRVFPIAPPFNSIAWTGEGTPFLFQVEGRVEGGVFCLGGGALLSRQVCMSPGWPAKRYFLKLELTYI